MLKTRRFLKGLTPVSLTLLFLSLVFSCVCLSFTYHEFSEDFIRVMNTVCAVTLTTGLIVSVLMLILVVSVMVTDGRFMGWAAILALLMIIIDSVMIILTGTVNSAVNGGLTL